MLLFQDETFFIAENELTSGYTYLKFFESQTAVSRDQQDFKV